MDETAERPDPAARPFHAPLAYLRAFLIALVVVHHAAQGYNVILPEQPASSLAEHMTTLRAISPVIDAERSGLLSLLSAFDDHFFMALLFLLSGLFLWDSLKRKGRAAFLRDRVLRLGLPLVAMALLRPLTYVPTYLLTGGTDVAGFWQAWRALGWRGGPIWFLEVLLLFDVAVVLLAPLLARAGEARGGRPSALPGRPMRFFLLFVALCAVAYVPVTVAWGSFFWLQVGPAQLQVNRLLLYAVYFGSGIALGAHGIERSFLAPGSALVRRWPLWTGAALVAFAASLVVSIGGGHEVLAALLYAGSGAAISFASLALFLRFVRSRRASADSLFRNSYGIYVVHYGIVAWLLFAALDLPLPAIGKWCLVSVAALAICWGTTAPLRRIPGVARVL